MQATPFRRTLVSASVGAALIVASGGAAASAFALIENSASGLGNAYAGVAAAAEDASTVWWNPAGMSRMSGMAVSGVLHSITPSAKFENGNSGAACVAVGVCRPLGSNGGDAGDTAYVPNMYFVIPMGRLAFGFGATGPFGLKTEYTSDWIGRYQAVKSDVKTMNINPSVSFKVNDMLALGAGVSYQKLEAEFTNAVNMTAVVAQGAQTLAGAGTIPAALVPSVIGVGATLTDGFATLKGDDTAYGYNVGALVNLSPATRLGLAYRSAIKYHVTGDVSFSVPTIATTSQATGVVSQILAGVQAPGQRLQGGAIQADIKMPDSWSVSLAHDVNPQLQVLADVSWTGWSNIPKLEFVRSTGVVLSSVEYNWKDTWRYSVGANWKLNDKLMLRGGVAFDQTPMDDAHRTPRLPDNDRTWVSLGARYMVMPNMALDFGYTHIFIKDPKINSRSDGLAAAYATIDGTYKSNVDIISVQASYAFK